MAQSLQDRVDADRILRERVRRWGYDARLYESRDRARVSLDKAWAAIQAVPPGEIIGPHHYERVRRARAGLDKAWAKIQEAAGQEQAQARARVQASVQAQAPALRHSQDDLVELLMGAPSMVRSGGQQVVPRPMDFGSGVPYRSSGRGRVRPGFPEDY